MEKMVSKKSKNSYLVVSFMCLFVYAFSYLSRKAVDSNVNEIMDFFGKTKPQVGLIGTLFFIMYAVGQVFHGIMCKKYNPRYTVFVACTVACLSNLVIGLLPKTAFTALKIIWLINGFSLAMLWPSIILLISKIMTAWQKKKALIFLAVTATPGTFLAYALSSLTSYLGNFKLMFLISAVPVGVFGVIWLLSMGDLQKRCLEVKNLEEIETLPVAVETENIKVKKSFPKGFIGVFIFFAFISVVSSFIKDGIITWTPTFLKEQFSLPNYFAVLLTLALPLVGMSAGIVSVILVRKCKALTIAMLILFVGASIFIGVIFGSLNSGVWVIILISLAITMFCMNATNNVVTSIYPLSVKGVNAGSVAGIIDGFCYLGSAISSYGFGAIAERYSWNTVYTVILVVSLVAFAVISVVSIISKIRKKPLF